MTLKTFRRIYYQKKASRKTRNKETGKMEYEIYDCRIFLDDKNKIILKTDCSCYDFANKQIKKIGKVHDTKFVGGECKHLKPLVDVLKKQGYKRKTYDISGDDKCSAKLRKQILEVWGHECFRDECHETNVEIHRLIPRTNGGKYSILNCRPLCKYHHDQVTSQPWRRP